MIMIATVLRVFPQHLLVRDISTGQAVQVNFRGASRFSEADRVRITYNGVMTRSVPPQITATNIQRISAPPVTVAPVFPPSLGAPSRPGTPPPPPPMPPRPGHPAAPPPRPPFAPPHRPGFPPPPPPPRPQHTVTAIVLQTGRNSLLVWNLRENRLMQVDFPNASQFRTGQLVTIGFNTMTFSNPPRISALTVNPA
ncbi:MAG: hypothetical protein FWG90_05685 [Oscillospiraceae bacterium]|nr:hypothetical protein [Oscillospiraceae bacterium]